MEGKNCGAFAFPCLQYALKCSYGILKVVLISPFKLFFFQTSEQMQFCIVQQSHFLSLCMLLNTSEVYITISFVIDQMPALRLTDPSSW